MHAPLRARCYLPLATVVTAVAVLARTAAVLAGAAAVLTGLLRAADLAGAAAETGGFFPAAAAANRWSFVYRSGNTFAYMQARAQDKLEGISPGLKTKNEGVQ